MTDTEGYSAKNARDFATKYASAESEKQLGQSFWRDFFLSVVGVSDLLVAGIEFEYPIRSSKGNIQFIDCLWAGVVLIEHKSAGKDLDEAEQQARDYLESLTPNLRPPSIIVSDFKKIRVIQIIRGTSYEFTLADLPDNLDRIRAVIAFDGASAAEPRVEADKKAVKLMGDLFKEFDKAGYGGHELSVFLIRILFLNFGDDTRMWKFTPEGLFGSYVKNTFPDGSGLGGRIQELFQVLNTPVEKRPATLSPALRDFPYVNGGLFAEQLPIFSFTAPMREALIASTKYDWSNISPAIFGAMFQTVKDKELRRESGEFYTSEKAIMRVISPLFLDALTERLQKNWGSVPGLKKMWVELGELNFLDPASGSGNFLLVAYKKLRELELKLIARLRELEGKDGQVQIDGSIGLKIHLEQFHAIEYDEWSSQIAFVAMFLADHQANRQMEEILGVAPDRFPLTESAVVKQGNALTIPWDSVCPMNEKTYIMGNPPFNGSRLMTPEQKSETLELWDGVRGAGELDYVANWFLISAKWASTHRAKVAFVATNSISQGEQPAIIWAKLFSYQVGIDFAYSTFDWDSDVGVHAVIIGYSTEEKPKKLPLWKFSKFKGEPILTWASNINPYLVDAPNVLVGTRSKPLVAGVDPIIFGSMPNDEGHLSAISPDEADEIRRTDPIASKYLRKLIGGKELTQSIERYCLWLVDVAPEELRKSPTLHQRVQKVKAYRLASKRKATIALARTPWLFAEIRQPDSNYIAIPRLTTENREYIPVDFFDHSVITNDQVLIFPKSDKKVFGLLMSKPFNVWVKAVSGRMRIHPRISGTLTYNNFPFPSLSDDQVEQVVRAVDAVMETRAKYPSSSLSDLYDPTAMPADLRKAHQQLDKAVLSAYGLKASAPDEDILAELFKRYEELTRGLI